MDLARHASVLWRFRGVAAAGLALGIVLAILGSYQPTLDGGPGLKPRGSETWQAVSSILVTQPGFPEGRVTLPTGEIGTGTGAQSTQPADPSGQVDFADPARLSGLADLYSKFLISDEVLDRVSGRPTSAQIQASPFSSSQGGLVLPVIQLTTTAPTAEGAARLNRGVFDSLRGVLADQQQANEIEERKRVEVRFIDTPEVTLSSGRQRTASILALFLCLVGTVALTHLLAGLRDRREAEETFASLGPWDDEDPDDSPLPPYGSDDRGAVPLHR